MLKTQELEFLLQTKAKHNDWSWKWGMIAPAAQVCGMGSANGPMGREIKNRTLTRGYEKGSHSDHVLARYALYNGNLLTDRVFNLDQYIDKDLPNELPRATAERHVTHYEAADYV